MSKYEEALERARKHYKETSNNVYKAMLEQIFPGIEESEDKKIKEEIVNYFRCQNRDEPCRKHIHDKWSAWIEKQGNSPIKWNKNTEGNKPQVNHSVLMKTTHGIAEGEWKGEYWEQYRWAGIVRDSDVLSWMELSDLDKQGEQKPQRIISAEAKEAMYDKPACAWSEEDEKIFVNLISYGSLKYTGEQVIDWLKSIKERYTWKPSDEQITVLELASKYERVFTPKQIDILIDLKEQLKKLRGE